MKIIKRNGSEATFDSEKIVAAITKANNSEEGTRLSPEQIHDIADYVEYKCNKIGRAVSVEEVQDMVENQIMATGAFDLAKHYVQYRYQRSLIRKSNTTDTRILSLIECNNEEAKQENSNKNPTVNSVQRDYMAGEVSKDLTRRLLLPEDIVEATRSFGATSGQLLFKVQLPLALPTIMAGVNQTIMMALSMVVIAAMISAGGLGEIVLKGITQMKIGLGFEGGIAVVILAIVLDRITQGFVRRK